MIKSDNKYKKRVWYSKVAKILSYKWNYLDPTEIVSELACNLRNFFKITGPISSFEKICAALNIVIYKRAISLDSILRQTPSGFEIIINSAHNETRQRFSISHEIGHLELYKAIGLTDAFGESTLEEKRSREAKEIEELCDYFASEFLMPRVEWMREIHNKGFSFKVIKRLMAKYKVSFLAAARRAVDVSVWNCLIVIWEPVQNIENLTDLYPRNFFSNIKVGKRNWPDKISVIENSKEPGSPLYTLFNKKEENGEISLSFLGAEGKYYAQSSIIHLNPIQAATIVIAERDPKQILLRDQSLPMESKKSKSQLNLLE